MGVHLCACSDLSFSYGNLDQAARQTIITIFLILPCRGLSIPNILYHQFSVFSFKLLLVSLPTLPPNVQQVIIAWPMMWSTLDVISYRKALCITTTSDWRRERDKRGILKCSVVFNASNKKKKPSNSFCPTKQLVILPN